MSDARDDSGPVQTPEPRRPPAERGPADLDPAAEVEPSDEGQRQAADTIRSISRLEESN